MNKVLTTLLLIAIIVTIAYFGYTTLVVEPTPKTQTTGINTEFDTKILTELEDFLPHGTFPISLDASKFRRDDPFTKY